MTTDCRVGEISQLVWEGKKRGKWVCVLKMRNGKKSGSRVRSEGHLNRYLHGEGISHSQASREERGGVGEQNCAQKLRKMVSRWILRHHHRTRSVYPGKEALLQRD